MRVLDLQPEIIDCLEIPRDGEKVMLRGYVSGRRCPGRIKAQVSAAIHDHPTYGADGEFSYGAHLAQARETLLAVVIGLEDDEADALSGDLESAGDILRLLGWWATPDDEADDDPEAAALSLISETFSPSLAPSTDSTTG